MPRHRPHRYSCLHAQDSNTLLCPGKPLCVHIEVRVRDMWSGTLGIGLTFFSGLLRRLLPSCRCHCCLTLRERGGGEERGRGGKERGMGGKERGKERERRREGGKEREKERGREGERLLLMPILGLHHRCPYKGLQDHMNAATQMHFHTHTASNKPT